MMATMAIEVRWGSATNVGCVRTLNQDATLAGPNVFAVADGMGGHAAGEVASAVAVARLAAVAADKQPLAPGDLLDALRDANQEIRATADADVGKRGMGTTVAGVALVSVEGTDCLMIFNLGDSRVYRGHGDQFVQLSVDHSVVGEMVRSGELSPEGARSHPAKNVVTRALGVDPVADVDSWILEPVTGDRFLVCSDGLTDEVDEAELAAALRNGGGQPQVAAEALIQLALDRGARDNVSVVLLEIAGIVEGEGSDDEDTNPRLLIGSPTAPVPAPVPPPVVDGGGDHKLITGVPSCHHG